MNTPRSNRILFLPVLFLFSIPILCAPASHAEDEAAGTVRLKPGVDVAQFFRDMSAVDVDLVPGFVIQASGAPMQYQRAVAGAPIHTAQLVSANPGASNSELAAQYDRRIQAVQRAIDQLNAAQVDHLRTADQMAAAYNLTLLIPTDGTTWGAPAGRAQMLSRVQAYSATLNDRYAAAQRELRDARDKGRDAPLEFAGIVAALEYLAIEKNRIVVNQMTDADSDIDYLQHARRLNDEADRELIIDRKLAVLGDWRDYLIKEKAFYVLHQDPRPGK